MKCYIKFCAFCVLLAGAACTPWIGPKERVARDAGQEQEPAQGDPTAVDGDSGTFLGGYYHVVRRGENLWRIAHETGVPLKTLAEMNGLRDARKIDVGDVLWIPGPDVVPAPESGTPQQVAAMEDFSHGHTGDWVWPVPDDYRSIRSPFGVRRGKRRRHAGVDISVPVGTAVRAAAPGRVSLAGTQRGYGKVVYVDHGGGYVTRYGHLSSVHVKEGQDLAAGEEIGIAGRTGNARGRHPHLHFEIRLDGNPLNPATVLPVPVSGPDGDSAAGEIDGEEGGSDESDAGENPESDAPVKHAGERN